LDGFGEVFIRRFLETQGLGVDDVVMVNADASLVPAMLERGAIDVGHTWEPYAEQVRALGGQVWFTSKETPGLVLDCLVVDDALLRNRRDRMQGLVRAWCRAVEWWQLHREEGNSIVERKLKLPENSVRGHGMKLLAWADNQRLQGQGPDNMRSAVEEHMDYFVRKGMSVRRVRPEELVDGDIMK
jgi:NitT/TauT family transport system substrate-binding protein